MRRSTLTIGERADQAEQIKKLTKHVSECVRRANAVHGEAGAVGALFTAQAVGVRARLRDACQRVILLAPGTQARRMEEILWRKVYYEPLASAKKMRKGTVWSNSEAFWVYNHLWSGVAYYHQLLHSHAQSSQLHSHLADLLPYPSEEDVSKDSDEDGSVDSLHRYLTCLGDLTRYMLDLPSPPPHTLSVRYYLQALHYQPDGGLTHSNLATVYSTNDQALLAVAHYLRALTCDKAFEGAEGNLKKLLDKSRAVYESGVELKEADSSPAYHHKMFLHTLLSLVSHLINNRETEEVARLCQDVLVQLGKVLETYDDAEIEVSETSPTPGCPPNGHIQTTTFNGRNSPGDPPPDKKVVPFSLTPEAMMIVCAVLCLCTQRLKKQGLSHTSMAQALLVSVLLTLISHVTTRLEQRISLVDPSFLTRLVPETGKDEEVPDKGSDAKEGQAFGNEVADSLKEGSEDAKKKTKAKRINRLANLRRRRRMNREGISISDEDESDSEGSGSNDDKDEGDDEDEIISSDEEEEEEELDFSQLCSSEDDDDSDEDVKIESDQWDGLTAEEHLQLIGQEGMLSAVFVACDWLKREDEVIHLCIKTADSLWTAIAKLLNLLRVDIEHLKNYSQGVRNEVIDLVHLVAKDDSEQSNAMVESLRKTPLPEDLMLHTLLPSYHANSQNILNLKTTEMVLLRVVRLCQSGQEMSSRSDTPLWRDADTGGYRFSMEGVVINENIKNKEAASRESSASPTEEDLLSVPPAKRESRRLAGMQSLTAQWLQHEVRNLEERTARRATVGLYLVPNATVLINNLTAVKLLLSKPTHMIIIPQTVIDSLDQQKRESLGARDAIRWLEIKFRHGSRFIRAQRPHERTHLPLIKYPKRKDKEAWEWYQILECCHYLSAQVQQNSNVKSATVTLLTAESQMPNTTFSHSGLAHAAGAVLENMEEFMRKWQTSTKGHS